MSIEQIIAFFNYPLITLSENPITIADVLIIPTWLISSYWLRIWLAKTFIKRLHARKTDPNVVLLLKRIFYILAVAIITITTLDMINVPITAFAFLSGAIAIGFGFGAQNIINNFISGWILIWEKPIRIGDFLEVDGVKGKVEAINTRSTKFKRVDGVHMLIPNSKLLENTVVNWTLVDQIMRTSVAVGVAYGSSAKQVAELMLQAAKEQPETLLDPKPQVYFEDFGDNALMFEVNVWIDHAQTDGSLRLMRSNIRFRIDELFEENNIVIAFPQRDVHIDGAIKIIK